MNFPPGWWVAGDRSPNPSPLRRHSIRDSSSCRCDWISSVRRRARPERDASTISGSGGQGRAVVWVTTLQGGLIQVVHAFGNHNSALSEGAAFAVVVKTVPGKTFWTRVGTDSPSPPAVKRRRASRYVSPASPGASARRTQAVPTFAEVGRLRMVRLICPRNRWRHMRDARISLVPQSTSAYLDR